VYFEREATVFWKAQSEWAFSKVNWVDVMKDMCVLAFWNKSFFLWTFWQMGVLC